MCFVLWFPKWTNTYVVPHRDPGGKYILGIGFKTREKTVNNRNDSIDNGRCASNTGYRTLSFEGDLSLSPVITAVRSGYQTSRCTIQRKGEIILTYRWGHGDPGTLYRVLDNGTLRPVIQYTREIQVEADRLTRVSTGVSYRGLQEEAKEAQALLAAATSGDWEIWLNILELHPWAEHFLARSGRGSSFIPENIVPDSEYLATKAKRSRIARFTARFGVEFPESVMTSPKAGLNFEPARLIFNPDEYLVHEKTWTGSLVDISTSEQWYGSAGNGKAVELNFTPEGEHGSNYAHSRTTHQTGKPGLGEWRNHRFLIKVLRGAYCRNHHTHGITVDVYDTWTAQHAVRQAA